MLDLLRVSSPFPRLTGTLDVSPPRIGGKVIPAKRLSVRPRQENQCLQGFRTHLLFPGSLFVRRYSVSCRPASFSPDCVCVCVCVCVKAGPGNAQNSSVIARRGLSESGTIAAVLEPLLRLSGQASPTGL